MENKQLGFFSLNNLNNTYPFLHGMRALALLIIMMIHVSQTNSEVLWNRDSGYVPETQFEIILSNLWFSMDCFFIMSGFLIGLILLRTKEGDTNLQWGDFKRFWVRRAFRIIPLYYFVLTAYIAITRFHKLPTTKWNLENNYDFFREFFFLVNYNFNLDNTMMRWTWSLSLEEHFYILTPFLIYFLRKLQSHKTQLALLVVLWLGGPIARAIQYINYSERGPRIFVFRDMYTPTHLRLDSLIGGVILAFICITYKDQIQRFLEKRWARLSMLGVPLLLSLMMIEPNLNRAPIGLRVKGDPFAHVDTFFHGILYYGTFTSLIYGGLLIHMLFLQSGLKKVLSYRPFLYFTTLSYGIYLIHWPIAYQIAIAMNNSQMGQQLGIIGALIFNFTLTVSLSILLAYTLHLLIEKPFLLLRATRFP